MPNTPFDGLDHLGFILNDVETEYNIHAACTLFAIHECHRHERFQQDMAFTNTTLVCRCILHFAITTLMPSRCKDVRSFVTKR